mmetsp:Transcript_34278/g.47090  ORF Transcript_34278/g.47090 Transcript_34278/m.47090 type:complete len:711 (+) Transcript_34278:39-2171(+)
MMKLTKYALLLVMVCLFQQVHSVCEVMNTAKYSALINPCIPVVNYPFYIPPNVLKAAELRNVDAQLIMQTMAHNALNATGLKIFSPACQQSLRAFTCASIYLACYNGLNYDPYGSDIPVKLPKPVGIPIYRPCVSVCTDIARTCGGLYTSQKGNKDCTVRMDYSGGLVPLSLSQQPHQFEQTNNKSICFTPASAAVAASNELYQVQGGVCTGVVSKIFVPGGVALDPSWALLQSPLVVQGQLEQRLRAKLAAVPRWLTSQCQVALRKYMCGNAYLAPVRVPMSAVLAANGVSTQVMAGLKAGNFALYNDSLVLPAYPNHSICSDFRRLCGGAISRSTNPLLQANCSAAFQTVAGQVIHNYPMHSQAVASVAVGSLRLLLTTSPNYMADANMDAASVAVVCPGSFVVPANPQDPNVQWVEDTGCAVPCVNPYWLPEDWTRLTDAALAIPIVGLVLCLVMALALVWDDVLESRPLLALYTLLSGTVSLWSIVVNARPAQDRFCRDNAVNLSLMDQDPSLCTAQAGIVQYTFIATAATFAMVYVTRVFKALKWPLPLPAVLAFILLPPIIPVAAAAYNNYLGFNRALPVCSVLSRQSIPVRSEFLLLDLPVLVAGVVCGVAVLLSSVSLDGTLCVLLRHHCRRQHAYRDPAKEPGPAELEETPEEKRQEVAYVDALLYAVPIVLIFGLYTAQRVEYYHRYQEVYDAIIGHHLT